MPNLLDSVVCPRCGARGKVKQYLVETVCREALVTELYEHGVEEIDDSTVTVEPVDGFVEETFRCAQCGSYLGSFDDLKLLINQVLRS